MLALLSYGSPVLKYQRLHTLFLSTGLLGTAASQIIKRISQGSSENRVNVDGLHISPNHFTMSLHQRGKFWIGLVGISEQSRINKARTAATPGLRRSENGHILGKNSVWN
jgi:hypothetical protein